MYCFTANASGRWLPLLSITLQELHFVSPPFVSFRLLSAPALATHARVLPFIPLRSCQPAVSFRSPLASLPTTRNSKPKREAPFHPTQFATFHSVITLAFPHANQRYALRSVCPEKKTSNTPPPFYGAGKNK